MNVDSWRGGQKRRDRILAWSVGLVGVGGMGFFSVVVLRSWVLWIAESRRTESRISFNITSQLWSGASPKRDLSNSRTLI